MGRVFEYLKYQPGRSLTPRYTETKPGSLIEEHMLGLCSMGLYREIKPEERVDRPSIESDFLASLAASEAKTLEAEKDGLPDE